MSNTDDGHRDIRDSDDWAWGCFYLVWFVLIVLGTLVGVIAWVGTK